MLAAGAGSGKTYSLVTVALGLYTGAGGRPPLDPARVVAVTFTEKAAAELRGRIVQRVRALADRGGDLADEPQLRLALGDRMPPAARWQELLRLVPLAPIGTFHGLCGQLLRQHAPEAHLDPRFAILDEPSANELLGRCLEETLLEALADEAGAARRLVRELGGLDALRSAIVLLHGKLAEEGRDPASLVEGSVFDPAAARASLVSACAALHATLEPLAAAAHPRLAGTLEALRRERARLGACEPERLAGWYPGARAVATVSRGRGSLPKLCKPQWDAFKAAWEQTVGAAAAVQQAAVGRDLVGLLASVEEAYGAQKRRRGALDFADLVRRTRDLLRDQLQVRREAKARVGALLVDEFQDTNQLQLELTHLLGEARDLERVPDASGISALPLEPAILCAVGDRKQSIYEFRGADVALFAELTATARAGAAFRLVPLTRSFRSRPELVELTNRTFRTLLASGSGRPYEVEWVEEEDRLHAERPPLPRGGPAAVELLAGDPTLAAGARRPFEAALVAARIEALLASPPEVEERDGKSHPLRGKDVALLLRAFTHLRPYRDALAARGIPSIVVRGRGFHRAREVRELAALLLLLCDPHDRFASAAVLRSQAVGLSDDALVLLAAQQRLALASHAAGCSEREGAALGIAPEDARRLDRLGPLVARLSGEVDRVGPRGVLSLAVTALDLLPALAASPDGEQRVANVQKLLASLDGLGGRGSLGRALALLAAAQDVSDREPPADASAGDERAVRILTVHGAKGLEWPVVVLPELGARDPSEQAPVLFERCLGLAVKPQDPAGSRVVDPHGSAVLAELKGRREAESLRLLYVAVTRARDRLILCGERGPRGPRTSWRALLDGALPPGAVELVEAASSHSTPAVASPAGPAPTGGPAADASLAGLLARALPPLLPAGRFTSGVSDLAALVRCERRFYYRSIAGLPERGGAWAPPAFGVLVPAATAGAEEATDLPPLDDDEQPEAAPPGSDAADARPSLSPRAAGTLAHLLLERFDLGASANLHAALAALAAGEGHDVAEPVVAGVIAAAEALLRSQLGAALRAAATSPAGARRIHRELPFVLALRATSGAQLSLSGKLDLLFVDDDGRANIVDYKLASAGSLSHHSFQLRTYALAIRRLLPPEVPLRAGIAWLRDGTVELADVTEAELTAHELALGVLADRLAAIRARGHHERLAARSACGDCGYAGRCWGEDSGTPPALP